ncbi:hypothetical protein H4R33_003308 [Dimargaris cristalligena]|nr:hypothetical protein H4R33_003308 [Dimargaris cristalligena]
MAAQPNPAPRGCFRRWLRRIFLIYVLFTLVVRCPDQFTPTLHPDAHPICRSAYHIKHQVMQPALTYLQGTPYGQQVQHCYQETLQPLYRTYGSPAVRTLTYYQVRYVTPWAHRIWQTAGVPAVQQVQAQYYQHAAPRVAQAMQWVLTHYTQQAKPHVDTTVTQVQKAYSTVYKVSVEHVGPTAQRLTRDTVQFYHQQVDPTARRVYTQYLVPFYHNQLVPGARTATAVTMKFARETIVPGSIRAYHWGSHYAHYTYVNHLVPASKASGKAIHTFYQTSVRPTTYRLYRQHLGPYVDRYVDWERVDQWTTSANRVAITAGYWTQRVYEVVAEYTGRACVLSAQLWDEYVVQPGEEMREEEKVDDKQVVRDSSKFGTIISLFESLTNRFVSGTATPPTPAPAATPTATSTTTSTSTKIVQSEATPATTPHATGANGKPNHHVYDQLVHAATKAKEAVQHAISEKISKVTEVIRAHTAKPIPTLTTTSASTTHGGTPHTKPTPVSTPAKGDAVRVEEVKNQKKAETSDRQSVVPVSSSTSVSTSASIVVTPLTSTSTLSSSSTSSSSSPPPPPPASAKSSEAPKVVQDAAIPKQPKSDEKRPTVDSASIQSVQPSLSHSGPTPEPVMSIQTAPPQAPVVVVSSPLVQSEEAPAKVPPTQRAAEPAVTAPIPPVQEPKAIKSTSTTSSALPTVETAPSIVPVVEVKETAPQVAKNEAQAPPAISSTPAASPSPKVEQSVTTPATEIQTPADDSNPNNSSSESIRRLVKSAGGESNPHVAIPKGGDEVLKENAARTLRKANPVSSIPAAAGATDTMNYDDVEGVKKAASEWVQQAKSSIVAQISSQNQPPVPETDAVSEDSTGTVVDPQHTPVSTPVIKAEEEKETKAKAEKKPTVVAASVPVVSASSSSPSPSSSVVKTVPIAETPVPTITSQQKPQTPSGEQRPHIHDEL